MNRQEHLEWCKQRALEYVDKGELSNALAFMFSDLIKHEELENHIGIQLGMMLIMTGNLDTSDKVRDFIVGFN